MIKADKYIHDFPGCSRTYATLCIYHTSNDPVTVTDILKIIPSRTQKAGDMTSYNKLAAISGWFLCTQGKLTSRDVRVHIEWILHKLKNKKESLNSLFQSGCEMRISCFWESATGNGGPILDHQFITHLSEFQLDLDFDVWLDVGEGSQ
jgi:hypothetical protein